MPEPLDAEGRVRLFLELYPYPDVAAEIVSDDRFRSDAWPRRMYALRRDDLVEVLRDLEIYEEELSRANARAVRDAKKISHLEEQLQGRHWFSLGTQKCTNAALSHWVDICKVCDEEREAPVHFRVEAQ